MTGKIELVVTDLDGTLWEQAHLVHPRTIKALADLADLDIPLLVATGRRVRSTREPLELLGLAPAAVVLNGALGLDLRTGAPFHRSDFDAATALVVLQTFQSWNVDPCVYVAPRTDEHLVPSPRRVSRPAGVGDHPEPSVWTSATPSTHADHLASFGDDLGIDNLAQVVGSLPVLAFSLLGITEEVAAGIATDISLAATTHVDRDRLYGGFTITVAPPRRSKWDGVVAYCEMRGIDSNAVLAIGDGPNDRELLDAAAIAVTPEDAHADALARADHVVGRAADGGWADIIDLLGVTTAR